MLITLQVKKLPFLLTLPPPKKPLIYGDGVRILVIFEDVIASGMGVNEPAVVLEMLFSLIWVVVTEGYTNENIYQVVCLIFVYFTVCKLYLNYKKGEKNVRFQRQATWGIHVILD